MPFSMTAMLFAGFVATAPLQHSTAAPADRLVSVYSDIARRKCASSSKTRDEDGPVTYRCRLIDGLTLRTTYLEAAVQISMLREGKDVGLRLGTGYDIGEKLEWRGSREEGKFIPAAAILRLITRTGFDSYASVLVVLRVDGEKICPAAWLDSAAAPNANVLARRAADEVAQGFRCGVDATRTVGPNTELVQEVIDRSR